MDRVWIEKAGRSCVTALFCAKSCGNDTKWYLFNMEMSPHGIMTWVINMNFERIRNLREDRDMTQQKIADMLNMKRGVYRRYEIGDREIPVWAVMKLADYYGVSTDYLLGRKDEP